MRRWWTWWTESRSRRHCSLKYPPPLQSPSLTPLGWGWGGVVRVSQCCTPQTAVGTLRDWSTPPPLTSWCILWYTLASLSRTTKDCEGEASPLKMKLRSPRWHFMSVKSMRVVSSLNPETEERVCEHFSVLLLRPKRSLWPGYQQFATLKTLGGAALALISYIQWPCLTFHLILIPCL